MHGSALFDALHNCFYCESLAVAPCHAPPAKCSGSLHIDFGRLSSQTRLGTIALCVCGMSIDEGQTLVRVVYTVAYSANKRHLVEGASLFMCISI